VGEWIAEAVLYNGNVVKLADSEALADLYDMNWIYVLEDGTYSLQNGVFTHEGVWYTSWKAEYDHAYTFEEQSTSRPTVTEEGGLSVQESESSGMYRVYLENNDTDTLVFVDADVENTLIYVRKDCSSDYVEANKIELPTKTTAQTSTDEVDQLLQGTWEYHGEDPALVEIFTFHNGSVEYTGYLEGAEEKGTKSEGTYQITDTNLITTINDYQTYFDYQIENGVLSFSQDITTGADKGNTRNYVQTASGSTAVAASEKEDAPASTAQGSAAATTGEKNALADAKAYLKVSAFSHDGLVDQLEYEGYSYSEAVYGADNCGADWDEQAVKSAKSYLKVSAFSYDGLVDQLEYEQFTASQATYGADNCGADWNEQASLKAADYLDFMAFSRDSLIEQLEYEGFTHEQAVYGAKQNGY
jgi:hypothetical protein